MTELYKKLLKIKKMNIWVTFMSIVNSAAMNIGEHVSFFTLAIFLFLSIFSVSQSVQTLSRV